MKMEESEIYKARVKPFESLELFFEDTMGMSLWGICEPIFKLHERKADRFNQIRQHVSRIPDWTDAGKFDDMVKWQYTLDMLCREVK